MSTALITGASSGIGEDIARQLAARGLNLILVARRKELLDKLADELAASHGITTTALACDLADRQSLGALFEQVDATLAQHNDILTTLVNNAGTGFWAPFAEQDLAGLQRDIDLNVTALTTLSHGFIKRAQAHGQRSYLLNVASLAGILPPPCTPPTPAPRAMCGSSPKCWITSCATAPSASPRPAPAAC